MNMEHCMFTNTLQDLAQCQEHLHDEGLSDDEARAREKLIRRCKEIAAEFSDDEDEE